MTVADMPSIDCSRGAPKEVAGKLRSDIGNKPDIVRGHRKAPPARPSPESGARYQRLPSILDCARLHAWQIRSPVDIRIFNAPVCGLEAQATKRDTMRVWNMCRQGGIRSDFDEQFQGHTSSSLRRGKPGEGGCDTAAQTHRSTARNPGCSRAAPCVPPLRAHCRHHYSTTGAQPLS
jgi:hypothetical protein